MRMLLVPLILALLFSVLAFVVAALLGRGKNLEVDDDAEDPIDDTSAAAVSEANRRAIIDRALDRARELSRLHRADGGRVDGDPNRSD